MINSLDMINKKTEWFRHDRFGMFIHWGIYSIPGKGEWYRSHQKVSIEDYQPYFDAFNPTQYNPKEWAKLAKAAGMKYMVLTAKHHDGFCLFDSKYTDYKVTNTPIGRDLVAEYVDAVRSEGLKVGLYFSLIDWHHKDYPKYKDLNHPMRDNEDYKDEEIDFENYLDYMHHQVEEIVTNYGQIDILWFDYSYEEMVGEKWRATELIKMVRKHQPNVIIDNRLETSGEGFGSIVTDAINLYSGDFVSPEQIVPHEGIRNYKGEFIPWELCITMNNNWAYNPNDHLYKPAKVLIRKLIECVSKNGNMILNVGPDALGNIPQDSIAILDTFATWMNQHQEAIYGCGYADLVKPEWGYYTRNNNTIYAHIFEQPIGPIYLPGLKETDIKRMSFLHDAGEVKISKSWNTNAFKDLCFAQYGDVDHFTYPLPNDIASVIKIELVGDISGD
ncbi:alpha-L-fucosidase [Granulicatella balaenopterae]|uniref:alpha-L-fucosidase n=1 Tax=Granulicatella balaenopterae TaxID=137733 RepID=A0A1H9J0C8_9LACT|nr:alpha-L-fucosidase [Granulicatella balaenopterae]SEQ80256.1 alpha-L-fucosidase [Granulicatella balaenopterae]